ncbi:hypothetical protein D7W81_34720 [Corallococcus aberystwythensis]|uniref:Uncharacterized protein n=1 Tax=Corallococcus aberystwythensis TaxID=2316722 RepID=A0A3A8PN58_9BACT|nr:hypothetical protein D7W81_34720 [Corallococcus aberystwythensis]
MLLVFVSLVLLGMLLLRQQLQGGRTLWGLVLVGMVFSALASNLLPQYAFWGWTLAALPALLVIHHGLYLGLIKPRVISQGVLAENKFNPRDKANLKDMVEANDRYFNTSNIALRYGLPALAIIAIGAVTVHVLNPVSKGALNTVLVQADTGTAVIADTTLVAARLGALGAYVYVLLYLGQRGFRHDITSGAALWCAVTLALGPLMAAALSKIWFSGLGSDSRSTGWSMHALYVAVGMSPRYAAQAIARYAHRLGSDATKYVPPERSVPLAMIRGITPQIEERLHEEGIHDVVGMAMADPLRLQRSTNFDKHQILGWIDSALLAQALPEAWEHLEKKGLRGARDLTWYVLSGSAEPVEGLKELAADGLTGLALRNVALRLSQDAQVQRIHLLYQLVDEAAESGEQKTPHPPSRPATETLASGLIGISGATPELAGPADGAVAPATNPAATGLGVPPAEPRQ